MPWLSMLPMGIHACLLTLVAMATLTMASNLLAMASTLVAMASNLLAMASTSKGDTPAANAVDPW